MMRTERIEQITAAMKSFHRDSYQKEEILPELFNLQRELVNLTFGIEQIQNNDLKIWDVENELTLRSDSLGRAADETLMRFKEESKAVCNLIKSEISGNRGEYKAFSRLEALKGEHRILRNVELTSGSEKTELDGVVFTHKGIFIIEVKNTKKNILIDEEGNYYRMGEYMNWDSNIGEKMKMREELLRRILAAYGYPECRITSIVVFTNRQVEVKNRNKSLKTTFLGPLPYIIDEFNGADRYTDEDLNGMMAAIEKERSKEAYAIDIDVNQYKKDFATVIAQLEEAQVKATGKEAKGHISLREIILKIFAPEKAQVAA